MFPSRRSGTVTVATTSRASTRGPTAASSRVRTTGSPSIPRLCPATGTSCSPTPTITPTRASCTTRTPCSGNVLRKHWAHQDCQDASFVTKIDDQIKKYMIFSFLFSSVQFHPEHMAGPTDLVGLFDVFLDAVRDHKEGGATKKSKNYIRFFYSFTFTSAFFF